MGCVAPAVMNSNGFCNYCPFPSIMGKMSTMKKIFRMIREIKEFSGVHIQANKRACLTEYVPLFFHLIYSFVAEGSKEGILKACHVMRDLNLPMDVFKEHIIGLQMCGEDHMFADLPTQSKSMFTKMYN